MNTTATQGMATSGAPLGDEVVQKYKTPWQGDWTTDWIEEMSGLNHHTFQI